MRVPFSWLKEFVSTDLSPEEVANLLTLGGVEVDRVAATPLPFEGVVIGEVETAGPHPEADRLQIATVFDGSRRFQVVCGAPNCRPGLKTAFARDGAILRADGQEFKIKKSKVRGIESEGMLCSERELGAGNGHEGIVELPDEWQVGRSLADYYGDKILELSLTPNLGHCFSVFGIAREVAALTDQPVVHPTVAIKEVKRSVEQAVSVSVEDVAGCPRYAARIIQGVHVGPSPEWLTRRLADCGLRSINNIVDITNLVMWELGQPLHAFDLDRIEGRQICVRRARAGERLMTLDGTDRELSSEMVAICDDVGPIAIGGIMGGQRSEVSASTENILIEAAHFDPAIIRKASKRLNLQTEASKRFERGQDPNGVLLAVDRAAHLIQQVAGGQILKDAIDLYQREFVRKKIHLRIDRLNALLGTRLSATEVEAILRRLECSIVSALDSLDVLVPTYRFDLNAEIDLIEEVGRLYGYQNIERKDPFFKVPNLAHSPLFIFERKVRKQLIGEGLQEVLTSNLINGTLAETTGLEGGWIEVLNPSSVEQSVLRRSLLPGLLQLIRHNANHQIQDIAAFEIGRVHFRLEEQFEERSVLGIALSGQAAPAYWDVPAREFDFFDLKGILENLGSAFGLSHLLFRPDDRTTFHPSRQARFSIAEREIGFLGEVHPSLLRTMDLRRSVIFAELDLVALHSCLPPLVRFQPLPEFPSSSRDWTITLPEGLAVATVFSAVEAQRSRLLKKVALIAIYRDASVGEGRKNVTFRFIYRDDRKTVSDEAVEAEHQRILRQVDKVVGQK